MTLRLIHLPGGDAFIDDGDTAVRLSDVAKLGNYNPTGDAAGMTPRDSARTVAVRLEQENAQLRAALTASVEGFSDVSIELRSAAIAVHKILAAGQA